MPVRSLVMLAALVLLGSSGCGVEAPGSTESVGSMKAASIAYSPMGFARVGATGAVADQFDSAGGTPTVAHTSGSGSYTVSFPNLAAFNGDHAQVSAEGTGTARCRLLGWSPSGSAQQVFVQCNQPTTGAAADSAFSVLYFRYSPRTGTSADSAYAWITNGTVSPSYSYNGSGTANTVVHNGAGSYTVTFPKAGYANASMMVTAYGGSGAPFCQISNWGSSTSGTTANVLCWSTTGAAADSDFSLSYSTSGPVTQQQSAHAWFNGTAASTSYSSTMGHISGCSNSTVTGSRSGTQASIVVQGDLAPWDTDTFRRASFVSGYGASPNYCRVVSYSASASGTNTTATTGVKCHDGSGAEITPLFTFTHTTSDVSGPC